MNSIRSLYATIVLCSASILQGQNTNHAIHSDAVVTDRREIPFEEPENFPAAAFPLISGARVVWLGELHGTNESPALFLGLVRLVSLNDRPPVVALEIPHGDQAAIDEYLKTGDDAVLKTRTFFSADAASKDGRASRAMAKLLERLRGEKVARVVCIDPAPVKWDERDQGMASNIAECVERFPSLKVLVLTGNAHSRVTRGTPWDKKYQPAAFLLKKTVQPVMTFDSHYQTGSFWGHTNEGLGEHKIAGEHWNGSARHYISFGSEPVQGHQGVIFSRTVSASPPWP
ncbi:MAG: SdeA [Verrucomicrobia bacterium]|nr:SdeA [Verrucomicrobiota bacterium]